MFVAAAARAAFADRARHTAPRASDADERLQPAALDASRIDVAALARMALSSLAAAAHGRRVKLQMAVEPMLTAHSDIAACQACVRDLLAGAISRAESGVLLTAMRHDAGIDIELLDDGATAPTGAIRLPGAHTLPSGATVSGEFLPARGSKVLLHLPGPPA